MNRLNRNIKLLLVVIIALSSFLMYVPTIKSGLIWDDVYITTSPLQAGKNPYSFFLGSGVYYRPFQHLSMLLDYGIWHLNPAGYHVTNIILHTINSLLVFLLGYHFMKNRNLVVNSKH